VQGQVSPDLMRRGKVARDLTHMRPLPRVLFGVTADDVGRLRQLVTAARHLPQMPTTRIYFDVSRHAGNRAMTPWPPAARPGHPGPPP
jgi:hypothetical protein